MEKVAKLFPEKIKPDVVAINCRKERLFIGVFKLELFTGDTSISKIQYRRDLETKPLPNLVSFQILLLSFDLNLFFPCALLLPMIDTLITNISTIQYRRR